MDEQKWQLLTGTLDRIEAAIEKQNGRVRGTEEKVTEHEVKIEDIDDDIEDLKQRPSASKAIYAVGAFLGVLMGALKLFT